jgi:hypothetical protein
MSDSNSTAEQPPNVEPVSPRDEEGKYFPPMYEASEGEIPPLKSASTPEKLVKIQMDKTREDNVFVIENVLTPEEAKWIVERGENLGFEPATVYSVELDDNVIRKDIRDNFRILEQFPALAKRVFEAVKHLLPQEIDNKKVKCFFHLFRYYKYNVGNNFAPHVDHTVYDEALDGTESRFTFILYLNEEFEGGQTGFPKLDFQIQPKVGSALAFRHENEHTGMGVTKGTKYVIRTDLMYQ